MTLPWKILLVDGTNIVIRYAFAMLPDIISTPGRKANKADIERVMTAVEKAIRECAKEAQCSHAIICLDAPGESWRKKVMPEYKANRNTVTSIWVDMLHLWFKDRGWLIAKSEGAEADDVIATLSARLTVAGRQHVVFSGDSDLLACMTDDCQVWQFGKKGEPRFVQRPYSYVIDRYGTTPSRLPFYKAMVGEPGDNIPGVRGIGPKKAQVFLHPERAEFYSLPADHSDVAVDEFERALTVVTLNEKVPLDPITPSRCVIPRASS